MSNSLFYNPPASGNNGDFSSNPVYTVGQTLDVTWVTDNTFAYGLVLWQQDAGGVSDAMEGPVIWDSGQHAAPSDPSQQVSFNWTVATAGFNLDYSPVFFIWALASSGGDGQPFSCHYFNISAPVPTSSSTTLTPSSTHSSTTTTPSSSTAISSSTTVSSSSAFNSLYASIKTTSVSPTSVSSSSTVSASVISSAANTLGEGGSLGKNAKIGIGVGTGVGVCLLIAACLFVGYRLARSKQAWRNQRDGSEFEWLGMQKNNSAVGIEMDSYQRKEKIPPYVPERQAHRFKPETRIYGRSELATARSSRYELP